MLSGKKSERSSNRVTPHPLRVLSILVSVFALLAACSSNEDTGQPSEDTGQPSAEGGECTDLAIGLMTPLTGDQAVFGQAGVDMGEWVISEFNEANPDCQIELIQFDTQGDPAQATALARSAVEDSRIVGVVGPTNSGEVESGGPILNEGALPFITPEATAANLSDNAWAFFHRTVGSDGQEGPADAQYMVDTFGSSQVAVIDNGIPYGVGLAEIVRDSLESLGVTIADSESIDLTGTDFSSTVNRIISSEADTTFCGCLYPEAGRLLKQLRAAGYEGRFMGGAGTFVPQFIEEAGATAAEGAVAASAGQDPSQSETGQQWLDSWNEFSGDKQLGLYAPEFYNAFVALTTAIGGGSTTREAINEYMVGKTFEGATGPFQFAENGDVSSTTVYFYVVEGGEFMLGSSVEV
jgi:branched-chain amino acid transport system substrate-binding protein